MRMARRSVLRGSASLAPQVAWAGGLCQRLGLPQGGQARWHSASAQFDPPSMGGGFQPQPQQEPKTQGRLRGKRVEVGPLGAAPPNPTLASATWDSFWEDAAAEEDGAKGDTTIGSGEGLTMTQATADYIRQINKARAEEGRASVHLALRISDGGCQGLEYGFGFEERRPPTDEEREFCLDGQYMMVSLQHLEKIQGSIVDRKSDLQGSSFAIENPNASNQCSCGSSFAV